MKLRNIFSFLLVLTTAGCAVTPESDDSADLEHVDAVEDAIALRDVDAAPAYFDYVNRYNAADDAAWIHARFNSTVGKKIRLDLHQRAEADDASVAFKLYKVLSDGRLRLTKQVEAACGEASYTFTSRGTGVYVVEMVSSGDLSELELGLSCKGGGCSPEAQPGEICGGFRRGPIAACAEGLYCGYVAEAICGRADAPGTCEKKPEACTAQFVPVCGCDGQTYGNACSAASSGVSVYQSGACEGADPE